jgi:hypothetical protein
MPKISIWETGGSQAAVTYVSGGVVTCVRVGCRMNGWPPSMIGRIRTLSAHFAPTTVCANITRC